MGKYLWPILVIALAVFAAGAWLVFPQAAAKACSAASEFFSSLCAEAGSAWGRMAAKPAEEDDPLAFLAEWNDGSAEMRNISSDDPDPASLTPEQRKRKFKELQAAAKARKLDVMRANLMKCPDGQEALRATRAYNAKMEEMKRLEERYGVTDDRVAHIRIEMVALKEAVQVANARYRTWKDSHPSEVSDPLEDKIYRDLVARSQFYRD